GRHFLGLIDEVEVFNRALSASEILAIKNAGSAGKCRSCAPAPASMVSWWSGNDNANDVQDGNNGMLENGAGFAAGEVAHGFSLNGSNQYVLVPDSPNLEISGAITIDAWINPSDVSNFHVIVSKYDSNLDSGKSYLLYLPAGGTVEWCVLNGTSTGLSNQCVETSGAIATGVFTHVAGTFDPTTQDMKIYVNGADTMAALVPGSSTLSSIGTNNTPVEIGAIFNDNTGGFFAGVIDEVEIFNRALTQREVQRIYDAQSGGKCPCVTPPSNMVAWWPGDDNAKDIQGGNDGTVNGATFGPGE